MTVTGQGQTQNVTRPGSQVVTNSGTAPSPPTLLPPGALTASISLLEQSTSSSTSPSSGTGTSDTGGSAAQTFSASNSGTTQTPPGTTTFTNTAGTPSSSTTNAVTQAVNNTNGATNPTQQQTQQQPPPPGATSQTVTGYTNGLITGQNGSVSTTRLPEVANSTPNDMTIKTSTTGTTTATILIRGLDGTVTSPTATLQLGGNLATSFFTNDQTYGASTTNDPSRPSTVKPVGAAATTIQQNTTLTSAANSAFTGGSCVCQYLTFGNWSSTINYTGTYRTGQTDIITQAPYIAGQVTAANQMPMTGSATYTGGMFGTVMHGTNAPTTASGTIQFGVNFASPQTITINANFDNVSYSGLGGIVRGTSNVFGSISGGGNSGSVPGSFFAGGGDPAKYLGGAFGIKGTNYLAGGIYATQRP